MTARRHLLTAFFVVCLVPVSASSTHPQKETQGKPGNNYPLDQAKTEVRGRLEELAQKNRGPGQKKIDQLFKSLPDTPESAEFLNHYLDVMDTMKVLKQSDWKDSGALERKAELMKGMPAFAEHLPGPWKDHINGMVLRHQFFSRGEWSPGQGGRDGPKHPFLDPESARRWEHAFRDHDGGLTSLGQYWKSTGDNQAAGQVFRRASLVNPKNTEAWNGLAQAQVDMGDYSGAVESAKRVLETEPANRSAIGIVKLYQGRTAPSSEVASGGAPGGTQFFRQASGGDFGKTAPTLEVRQTVAQAPPRVQESVDLSNAAARMLARGDTAEAKRSAQKSLALFPDNVQALRTLAKVYMQNRDYVTALGFIEQALRQKMSVADRGTLLLDKSGTLSNLRRFNEALEAADLALKDSPTNGRAYLFRSVALSGLGRDEEALETLAQGGKYDPQVQAIYDQAMSLAPDTDLFAFLTGERPAATAAAPAKEVKPGKPGMRWGLVAGGVLVGLLLVVLGVTQGGTLVTSITRGLGRLGSASPAVQPMVVGAPPPADGLAASGIRIDKKIGQGGMGVVYSGMDTSLERPVAIKKMREEIRSDMREKDRFIKEAKTVAAMRHPNIVEIYSIIEDGADVYLVFEYVTGKTVHDITYERGALPVGWAVSVIKAVASALDYAHKRGVVHRDLKPSNIMVEDEGMVKVMDFGVARMAKDSLSRMSMTNTVVGTPPYMAPEQEQGIVRKESDVYALAVCLYEMVTGTLPFQGMGAGMLMAKLNATYIPASRVVQGIPEGFDAVMAQALQPDPDKRIRTAGEFAAALSAISVT